MHDVQTGGSREIWALLAASADKRLAVIQRPNEMDLVGQQQYPLPLSNNYILIYDTIYYFWQGTCLSIRTFLIQQEILAFQVWYDFTWKWNLEEERRNFILRSNIMKHGLRDGWHEWNAFALSSQFPWKHLRK